MFVVACRLTGPPPPLHPAPSPCSVLRLQGEMEKSKVLIRVWEDLLVEIRRMREGHIAHRLDLRGEPCTKRGPRRGSRPG